MEHLVHWAAAGVLGEVTLVIDGAPAVQAAFSDEDLRDLVHGHEHEGSSRKDAIALVVSATGLPKRRVYNACPWSGDASTLRFTTYHHPHRRGLALCEWSTPHRSRVRFGVPSDVFSRYMRMAGKDVLMVSDTDEHGTPIQVRPTKRAFARELADRYNRVIAQDLQGLGLSLRPVYAETTTRNHAAVVQGSLSSWSRTRRASAN